MFSLIFETVSAYGTVGLSLGNNRVSSETCNLGPPVTHAESSRLLS